MLRYGDKVKITRGFYREFEGRLVDIDHDNDTPQHHCFYDVEIITFKGSCHMPILVKTVTIPEDYLEKIEE